MSLSAETRVSEVYETTDIDFAFPDDLSFFRPYLPYYVRETLAIGGQAYVSTTPEGDVSGLFIYDEYEKTGTIFTRSTEAFDHFYGLKPFDFLFAEMRAEHECETYDIHSVDVGNLRLDHRFSYEISVANQTHLDEIEHFMVLTHPGINKRWVNVALKDGEKCFIVRLGNEIAGLGWVSIVNGVGRLHSLFVKPQFRRIGIGEDILFARLFWLKAKHAHSAFSEISRYNSSSSRIAMKGQMKVSGQVFQYFRKDVDRKEALKR
jgi:ribosomal protein S18 acetylase RimI-like enzyme